MKLEYADDVAVLTLKQPPVNALGLPEIDQIRTLLRELRPGSPLVMTGNGAAFCAGVNTRAFESYSGEARASLVYSITKMVSDLLSISGPVVAAVNGHALGGGMVLMLSADYRLVGSEESIQLGLTEAAAGIPFPAGPLEVIRAELAPDVLRSLTLSSKKISPTQALQLRIVDEVASVPGLVELAVERARELASQPGFVAVKDQVRGPLRERVKKWQKP